MDGTRNLIRPERVADHARALQKHSDGVHPERRRSQLSIHDHGFIGTKRDGLREGRVSHAHVPQRDRPRRNSAERVTARFVSKHADGGPNDLHRGTRESRAATLRADHALD